MQGETVHLTAGSFVACTPGVTMKTRFGGLRAFFSGEGAFYLECSGSGDLFFNAYGAVHEREVNGSFIVDTGHLVAWESSLRYEIKGMGGLKQTLFSGEDGVTDPHDLIPQVDPLYGSFVGRYRIDTILARGGMGTVYKAVLPDAGEDEQGVIAVKLLPAFAAASPEVRRRFMAEAKVTQGVIHPNVSQILEISETEDGRLYLLMPFYEGPTLQQRLLAGAMPVDETTDWFRQTITGLAVVHEAGRRWPLREP